MLLVVSPGNDTAGCGIALKYAFDQHAPGWTAHHVRRSPSVYDYPVDQPWVELATLWRDADLVHIMNDARILQTLPRRDNVFVQHLGSAFRRDPVRMGSVCRRFKARQVGSLDLLGYRGVEWLPVTFDSAAVERQRRRGTRRHGRVRVAHAPTNRALKSTDIISEAIASLRVEFDLIEGVPNRECLERKARADIFVDELTLGYGLNAIEAWALGIPVVSGMTVGRDWLTFEPPWVDATAATLVEVVRRLVDDPALRTEAAQRGKAHVDRYHSPRAVVERVLELAA